MQEQLRDQLTQELQWRDRPDTESCWQAFELDERLQLGPASVISNAMIEAEYEYVQSQQVS